MSEPKYQYQELAEEDESGGLLGRTAHPHPNRLRFSRYLLYAALAISLLFNTVGLWYKIRSSNDICIPNPLFCKLTIAESHI